MPNETLFDAGDLVRIKSGGPVMTVRGAYGSDSKNFECQWFAGKKLEMGRFPGESLVPVEDEPK